MALFMLMGKYSPDALKAILETGTFSAFKSVPLFTAADVQKASKIAKKVATAYKPPKA